MYSTARLEASNSTGSVTSWKMTENENRMIASLTMPARLRATPMKNTSIQALEAALTTGTMAARMRIGA